MKKSYTDKPEPMAEITAVYDHIVDIELVNHTKERLSSHLHNQHQCGKKQLICRVPKKFLEIDGSDYVPRRWSIGPYHNGDERLKKMDASKLTILSKIHNCEQYPATLEKYYQELWSTEEEARSYYYGNIPMNTLNFREMLLLDSCFILGSLGILEIPGNPTDAQVRRHSIENDFLHDVLLFENQIPFFILERMYNVAIGDETHDEHVASKLGYTLMNFVQLISKTTVKSDLPGEIYHLIHLLHWFLKPSKEQNGHSQVGGSWLIKRLRLCCLTDNNQQDKQFRVWQVIRKWLAEKLLQWMCPTNNNKKDEQFRRWRRAVEYYEAGVHFKPSQQSCHHSPLDIKFENGELRIPMLIIDEKTSYIFGNLLAFEEETARFGYDITTYITFMSQLLSMPEDVTLLSRKGIIEHHLGCDEDVSKLFKNLTKFRFVDMGPSSYLKPVCDGLEKHYQNHWNRWFAWLRHKHMKNPWLILALLVAAIVAISAVVQAFCSVIPLVHGKDSKNSS